MKCWNLEWCYKSCHINGFRFEFPLLTLEVVAYKLQLMVFHHLPVNNCSWETLGWYISLSMKKQLHEYSRASTKITLTGVGNTLEWIMLINDTILLKTVQTAVTCIELRLQIKLLCCSLNTRTHTPTDPPTHTHAHTHTFYIYVIICEQTNTTFYIPTTVCNNWQSFYLFLFPQCG